MENFFDLREAILKFDALPESPEKEILNRVIYRAIEAMTTNREEDGRIKEFGLSGETCREWRQEFKNGKKLTWGDFRDPNEVPAFNLFQADILEAAGVWGDKAEKLRLFMETHLKGENSEPDQERSGEFKKRF